MIPMSWKYGLRRQFAGEYTKHGMNHAFSPDVQRHEFEALVFFTTSPVSAACLTIYLMVRWQSWGRSVATSTPPKTSTTAA